MYEIYKLPVFERKITKLLTSSERKLVEVFIERLRTNPFQGKPLTYDFLREKRIGGKRIYFLIYEEICFLLFVSASDKKTQQETIDLIKKNLEEFRRTAYEIHKKLTFD